MAWNLAEADAKRIEAREQLTARAAGVHTHWDDVHTELSFLEKSRRRKPGALRAQERYVRNDIPCGIDKCATCFGADSVASFFRPRRPMARERAEYVVPDAFCLLQCMELLEEAIFGDVVKHMLILQTVYLEALRIAPSRDATRLKNFFREDRRMVADTCVYLFPDQHHAQTSTKTQLGGVYVDLDVDDSPEMEPLAVRNERAILKTLTWYQRHHVSASSRLLFMTRDIDSSLSVQVAADVDCEVVTCEEFLDQRFKRNGDFLRELAFNTAEAIVWWAERRVVDEIGVAVANAEFTPHLPLSKLSELVATGKLLKGKLDVSLHNPMESFVVVDGKTKTGDVDKVFIYGREDMNRGVHGDQVVVQLLPKENWRTPQSDRMLVHYTADESDSGGKSLNTQRSKDTDDDTGIMSSSKVIPTGYVVGVLQRSPRFHVATILSSTVGANDDYGLAIPMDNRIPKVRIRSQRMDTLVDKRLKVVIDHWAVDSMYPNGHYVGVLGETGSLSTELSALLVQNEIEEAPFSEAALACLPECDIEGNRVAECSTAKRPQFCGLLDWHVPPEEMAVRRDLRSSHRVFSVDPPGCQDIDDAMSVRRLPNGNIELGVHIADVSYFVTHESPLDYEARSRATTVYLVGMRLDMLPSVLSGDLCSLHQNVDRLAVSVIWELDGKTFNIVEDKTWFGRSIIRSCSSMTYEQAHRMLQGLNADGGKPLYDKNDRRVRSSSSDSTSELPLGVAGGKIPLPLQMDLREDLNLLTDISRKLAQTRGDQGGLDLSKHEEVRFSLNVSEMGEEGVEIIVKESLEIHSTIAELMIIANSCVAKCIVDVFPTNALLRRHPPPSGDRFAQLIKIAQAKDIVIDATNNYTLQQSLMTAEKKGNVDSKTMALLKSLAVRVMSQAEYVCASDSDARSDKNDDLTSYAHYGLGLQHYTHFTSPIRRYADIIVHRQLLAALETGDGTLAKKQILNRPVAQIPQPLPPSVTMSVFDEDEDFLDELISSIDNKLHVEERVETVKNALPASSDAEDTLFPPSELVPLTHNLNKKNRNAKLAARDCDELFLALYFSSHTIKVQAVITSLKQNGFIVYVPKYDIRAPVYIRDKDGVVQMDPLLCGVRIVDTHPPTGAFANADCIRMVPQAQIVYDSDAERLEVSAPSLSSSSSSGSSSCVFKILDEVEVQISCDLSATTARVPQLQLLLVGRVKTKGGNSQRRDASTLLTTMKSKADTSIPELQRYVQKESQIDQPPPASGGAKSVSASRAPNVLTAGVESNGGRNLYNLLESPLSISPVKKPLKKVGNAMAFLQQKKPAKEQQKNQSTMMKKRGPGRLVFGDYEPPAHQHYQQKLAQYMDTRSDELEEELNIHRRGQSSALSQDLKRTEREALSRLQKLAAEKRHDKINKRNKAN